METIRNGIYHIRSGQLNNSAAYLELQDNHLVVSVWNSSSDAQKWMVVSGGDGAYNIICVLGNNVLGVNSIGKIAGLGPNSKHLWTIEPRGSSFVIGNAVNQLAINLAASGRVVEAANRDNSTNQRWVIEPNPIDIIPNFGVGTLSIQGPHSPLYTYFSIWTPITVPSGWRYCLSVDMPTTSSILRLESLDLIIKYATRRMTISHGTYQVEVVATSESLPTGITPESTALSIYHSGGRYRPYILDKNKAVSLFRKCGVKQDSDADGWRHEVISEMITPSRAVPGPGVRVYVLFHVYEYDIAGAAREVTMDAAACWVRHLG